MCVLWMVIDVSDWETRGNEMRYEEKVMDMCEQKQVV